MIRWFFRACARYNRDLARTCEVRAGKTFSPTMGNLRRADRARRAAVRYERWGATR